jgi:hypothetical protein
MQPRPSSKQPTTRVVPLLGLLCALAAPELALAQADPVRTLCTNHGPNLTEPVPGREAQSFLAAAATCVVQGGPMNGAVETQHNLWHYDKGAGTLLSGQAMARMPGGLGVTVISEGTLTFQTTDGKVTGWSAAGKGRVTLAAGTGAALAGKRIGWTASPTGPRSYVVTVTYEP